MVGEATKLSAKDFGKNSLGRVFPDFDGFYKELKPQLGFVILRIIKEVDEHGKTTDVIDWPATKARGLTSGYGILDYFIARNFYRKFRSREYVGEQRDFIDEFVSELAMIIAEIRRKEHIWIQLFREIDKWTKLDKTETEKVSESDKSGKTTVGDGTKHQLLSKELTDKTSQHGTASGFSQKGGTIITTHKGSNFMPLGRILGALSQLQINFSEFYPRFEHLWNHYSAPSLEWVIDKTTGRRKWVTEEEYEEIVEPEKKKGEKIRSGCFCGFRRIPKN